VSSQVSDVAYYTVDYAWFQVGLYLRMNQGFDIQSIFYCLRLNFNFNRGSHLQLVQLVKSTIETKNTQSIVHNSKIYI
jgi:hypothetical protein